MSQRDAEGVALAFELTQLGIEMQAQRYRRQHPHASDEDVTAFVQAWLLERPGAPNGDADGRSVPEPA